MQIINSWNSVAQYELMGTILGGFKMGLETFTEVWFIPK